MPSHRPKAAHQLAKPSHQIGPHAIKLEFWPVTPIVLDRTAAASIAHQYHYGPLINCPKCPYCPHCFLCHTDSDPPLSSWFVVSHIHSSTGAPLQLQLRIHFPISSLPPHRLRPSLHLPVQNTCGSCKIAGSHEWSHHTFLWSVVPPTFTIPDSPTKSVI